MSSAGCSKPDPDDRERTYPGLRLGEIPGPDGAIRVFATGKAAIDHMLDHLLTAPECEAWAVLLPGWSGTLIAQRGQPELVPERTRFFQRLRGSDGAAAQALYDDWRQVLDGQHQSAQKLGWIGTRPGVRVCLGIHAVLMIIVRTPGGSARLKTAFIPGQGRPEEVRAARAEGRHRHDTSRPTSRRARWREKTRLSGWLEANGTPDQQYFYRVFRPAVRFLRDRYNAEADGIPDPNHRDYDLVYEKLPRVGAWSWADWASTRDRL